MLKDSRKHQKIKTYVVFPQILGKEFSLSAESRLEEAVRLAQAINLDVIEQEIVKVREVRPAIFFGNGFLEKLSQIFNQKEITLLIVDTSLTPIQQRNIEKN